MSSYSHDGRPKPRGGKVVKPMLRKFTQSEKNSLDLDRPAAEQEGLGIYDFGSSKSAHDVTFSHANRRGYHARSTSGTSQFSTATSASGPRSGSFVHPFQQTPRPYTPPLAANNSYQNSLREDELSGYSPALTEDEEQNGSRVPYRTTSSGLATTITSSSANRTPSLTRVSTSSNTLSNGSKPLRVQTKQQTSASRLAKASHTSLSSTLVLSPDYSSPTDTMSPVSAIRNSVDLGFRLRSRSDAHHTNPETIEEARRRWDMEQRAKEEKYAKEEIRKREKQHKAEAKDRMGQGHHRRSSASEATRSKRSKSDLTIHQEKSGIFGQEYTSTTVDVPPVMDDTFGQPKQPRTTSATHNAKKKANSSFHAFLMWLRTRILRIKKRTGS